MKQVLNIALVAHDSRKKEMLEWVQYNAYILANHNLYATGTTGTLVANKFHDLACDILDHIDHSPISEQDKETAAKYVNASGNVHCLLSGPLGGDAQIGAMIAEGKIDILIFFSDNLVVQGHNADIEGLCRIARIYPIGFATNRTTADFILTSTLLTDPEYEPIVPACIANYKNRKVDV